VQLSVLVPWELAPMRITRTENAAAAAAAPTAKIDVSTI
jgi:hypothetical protein